MANRQTGGKSGKRIKAAHQNLEQNQFGLKEAYTVLQRDFLELKKAYIGNEQQLVGMQEQCFILQQAYEELQKNSQDQQAKLVEKLEKGYDAYNEKFTRVEELEEKLDKCNKLHNENQVKAENLQDQINQLTFQRQVFEEAVKVSLANVGLSLLIVNGNFEINILDYKKVKQLAGYRDDCSTTNRAANSKKVAELEHENAFLQQALLSLKDYSEKQRDELTKTTDMLQKKSEECLNLNKGSQKQGDKGTILVETKALEKIVSGLSEMSDFVVELKKTICNQNSWIAMLVEALDEYRKSQISKDDKNKTAIANVSTPINKLPVVGRASHSGTSGCEQNSVTGRKNKSKKKTKNPGHKVNDKSSDNCSNTASGNTGSLPGNKTRHPSGAVPISSEIGDQTLEEFEDYIVVPSGERSAFEHAKIAANHFPASFSSLQTETKVPINREPKSLQQELHQMSSVSISDRRKTCERYETDSPETFPRGIVNDTSIQEQGATNNDMCPMCNKIFEKNCDLEQRRSHINRHFED